MNIAQILDQASRTFSERPAVCVGTRVWCDYAGLRARSAALAAALNARGLANGDRVAIWAGCRPEYFEILFGIWAAGCTAVPVNAKLHPREVDYIVANSGARLLFTDRFDDVAGFDGAIDVAGEDYAGMVADGDSAFAPARALPADPAWIFYTSGTTGRPKGATLTHRNLWAMTTSFLADMGPVAETSAALAPAPLSHAAGLFSLPFFLRGAANAVPESGGFDAGEIVTMLHAFPRASFFAAPTMLNRLVTCPALDARAIDAVDLIFVGGAPIYVEDLRAALDVLGPKVWVGYGQGEAPCTISYLPPHFLAGPPQSIPAELAGSVGIARTGVDVRVVDDDGRDCPPGVPGEVVVAGDVVMAGYWDDDEATDKALQDGYLWTGDIGELDARGILTLKDRSKDVIISGGSNIYPREVEEVLLRFPGVSAVNVIGAAHPEWGEMVVAFVVAAPDVTAEMLDKFCLDNIARFKRPRTYRFTPELPTSSYGKILKSELRRMLADASTH